MKENVSGLAGLTRNANYTPREGADHLRGLACKPDC